MEKPIYCYRIWDENKRKLYSTKTNRSIWMNAPAAINHCLMGRNKTSGNYIWKFKD